VTTCSLVVGVSLSEEPPTSSLVIKTSKRMMAADVFSDNLTTVF